MSTTIPRSTIALGKLIPGQGGIGLRDQEVRPPGAGQALIEVAATGICGTDLHIEDDEFPYQAPVTMGHEVTGMVVEVGEGVDVGWIGRRVACETYYSYCEACLYCRSGRPNLCERRRSIGSYVDGGFARWMTIPIRNLHVLPDHVGIHAGALTEPLACVTNCLFDPAIVDAGDDVLVTGPGTMGLLTAQAARASGGRVVLAGLAKDAHRLQVAASLGLETLVLGEGSPSPDGDFDVVCECSGAEAGAALALAWVRKGGRYVQVGIFGRPVTLAFDTILYKELTVSSGNASTPGSWKRAITLVEAKLVDLNPLVTGVFPLSRWEEAFAATRRGEGIKIVIDPRAD